MLISAALALALFAAPETTQSGDTAAPAAEKPAAEAQPAMRKVCYVNPADSGSHLARKKCVMEKVPAPKKEAQEAPAKGPAPGA